MRASLTLSITSKPDNIELPKKSAMVTTKKPKLPGRRITFAAEPTFYCIAARENKCSMPSYHHQNVAGSPHHHHHELLSSKVCLCSPTNHPGSFRCRLHRNMPLPKHVVSSSSSSSSLDHATCSHRR